MNELIIISGHYGVGKTSFALSYAKTLRETSSDLTLIDMDIVNPYFRSSDERSQLEVANIHLIAPHFAGSTLENPSIPAEVATALSIGGQINKNPCCQPQQKTIVDTGGDAEGIRVLGRYADIIKKNNYKMLYVFNASRPQTASPDNALAYLREIEKSSGLKVTGLVSNTHLKSATTIDTICASIPYAMELSQVSGLALDIVCIPNNTTDRQIEKLNTKFGSFNPMLIKMESYTRTPWEY